MESIFVLRIVVDYDFLFLPRSIDFEDDSVGMAVPDAVCTDRAAGINKVCVIEVLGDSKIFSSPEPKFQLK